MEYKGFHIVKNGTKWELRLKFPTERISFPTLHDLKNHVNTVLLVKVSGTTPGRFSGKEPQKQNLSREEAKGFFHPDKLHIYNGPSDPELREALGYPEEESK